MIHKKEISIIPKVAETRKTPTPPPTALAPSTPPPPPPDPEVLFYSTIAHNIRENLTHHLDGKLDSQEVMEYDLNKATAARNKVLNFSASFTSETTPAVQPEATSTPVQQKEPRSTPISPRALWEKFNFPKNYDGRCGLTSYIKDMSHLDISTQLTMRRNLQRLNSSTGQESNKESPANIPAGLLLVEKPLPDCAETFGEPQINKERGGVDLVLSGEWVRPRTFLCSACGYKSSSLWDVEDHKYALHPNVWVPHIEIVGEQSSAWDWFYHRRLPPDTKVEETTPTLPSSPPPCSKCGRQCAGLADLHRHMLECGGDTTWQATMLAVSSPGARRRKWRPFGSRRRKQQGRRGLKRNIPNTPAKHSCGRIRTKPGDMDTIQKMIANLPPKRATRRVIGEDPDIKTRSQATISSVPISSIATHSSAARAASIKSSKVVKNSSKLSNQKKLKGDSKNQPEDNARNKGNLTIKEEPLDNANVKEEDLENEFQPLEAENTIQHSDILTSLQMIPVVRKSTETEVKEAEQVLEEPIETSKIIAAMREAMLDSEEKAEEKKAANPYKVLAPNKESKFASEDKTENKNKSKLNEKKKKLKTEDKNKKTEAKLDSKKTEHMDTDVIICYGCGMQFDNLSACQRHKKKCVYWKEDKSNGDNKTNKCVHCGSVFPYLMALLKHNCSKKEVMEEPAMPELCPEQPVEEVQCDSVEDIPILSPVDVSRDEVSARRMSLLDLTLSEVASESFDVTTYHTKYFNSENKTKDHVKSPVRKKSKTIPIKVEKVDDIANPVNSVKNESSSTKQINDSVSEITPKILSESSGSTKSSPTSKKLIETNKIKLPGNKQGIKNKKVSDIFKEVKRRGRRRHKMKVKVLVTKLGIRKTINSSANLKKKISPRKRSSNFVMLMKEWEKLEKEGAVAVGKRKRVFSHSEINFENLRRRRRRFSSENSKTDFCNIDSFTMETSRNHDQVEPSPSRKTRRRDSVGTINDIPPEVLKEISEQFSSTSPENVNKEKSSSKLNSSKKRKSPDTVDENTSDKASANVFSLIKTELEEPLLKRKPGRPRVKSLTVETEKHIYQTIDSVLKGSIDYVNNYVNKDENHHSMKKNLEMQSLTTSTEHLPLNVETEEHILQAIEKVVENEWQGTDKREESFWKNISDIIYNVSIGNAEVLKEEGSEKIEFNTIMPQEVPKKRRRKRRRVFTKPLKSKSNLEKDANSKETNLNKEMGNPIDSTDSICQESIDEKNEVKSRIVEKLVSIVTNNGNNAENDQVNEKECEKLPAQNLPKVEMKVAEMRDEINCIKTKPKEIKTKQLSIADYLSISNVPKKSTGWSFSKQNKLPGTKINENNTILSNYDTKEREKTTKMPFSSSVKDSSVKENKAKTQPNISEMSRAIENMIKKNSKNSKDSYDDIDEKDAKDTIDDKPNSPISTSSKEDVALSVIREKVIQKRKKKLKLKKLLKIKKLEPFDSKVCKVSKVKIPLKEEKQCLKEKVRKGKRKKLKVGVSRNRWEVSIVANKNTPVEIFFQDDSKSSQSTSTPCNDLNKKFYCAMCDQKFESSYFLYEHQQTQEHKSKSTDLIGQKSDLSEENDPVKYCKSIGNIINDLETHKLNVNKVMHHLKLRESTETVNETVAAIAVQGQGVVEVVSSGNNGKQQGVEDNSTCWQQPQQQEWGAQQQEWSSRSTTPLWEQQQPWDHDGFSGPASSLGSIMDTVNKLLSSDQELVATPGYTWTDLQLAMGASDEEMAMLEQLGEHSLQEEYVYDNSRPAEEWPAATDDSPTFTDLDRQDTPGPTSTFIDVKKQEPISDSEDSKACRGSVGRPRRLLGDYESREMVCPTCNKHFLGLPALQTHVAWSHCSLITHAHTSRLKRRALVTAEEVDRRLVCFVCKEIVASASLLEQHIQAQHTKKDEQELNPKQVLSESAVKLKSKMSLALGGLVDRALNKLLGTGLEPPPSPTPSPSPSTSHNSQSDLNSGALQLLGRLCAARKRVGSENMKLSADILQLLGRLRAVNHKDLNSRAYNNALAHEMRQILSRGKPVGVSKGALQASVNSSQQSQSMTELKPTNLLDHLAVCSSDITQRPYACPICDLRFLIPSTRNRHIARAHGKYGRRYDEEVEDPHVPDDLESGWKDVLDPGIEANDDGEMLPLCSDCGLSFQSIHEVIQHRIEDHPRRFSADEDCKPVVAFDKHPVVESSSEHKQTQEPSKKDDVKMLPVSDNAIDSTSTEKKKRGRPSKALDCKTVQNIKLPETEKKTSLNQKTNRGLGKKKIVYEEVEYQPETTEDYNEDDENSDSLEALSIDESITTESTSPEIDKSSDKLSDKHSNRTSSEENLAELSKKLDRRKVRMANMAEDAVRVKAEAALRELNLPRKTKSPSSAAKWGINALKFTKQMSSSVSSSRVNGSPSKPRFASLVDKKWKLPATTGVELITPKAEIVDVKPDIYDFRDEELDTHKKPFQQFKESHPQGTEHSESNNLVQPSNWSITGSPTKTSQSSKLSSDSS